MSGGLIEGSCGVFEDFHRHEWEALPLSQGLIGNDDGVHFCSWRPFA